MCTSTTFQLDQKKCISRQFVMFGPKEGRKVLLHMHICDSESIQSNIFEYSKFIWIYFDFFLFFSAQSATQNAEKTGRKLGNQVDFEPFNKDRIENIEFQNQIRDLSRKVALLGLTLSDLKAFFCSVTVFFRYYLLKVLERHF